jgi:hypothetical protein
MRAAPGSAGSERRSRAARAATRFSPQIAQPGANWLTVEPQLGHFVIALAIPPSPFG